MSQQDRPQTPVIAPSMLKCDFGNLDAEIQKLEAAGAATLHLDVMDGHFVPNLSYGPMVIERIRERTKLILDAHLMISDPEKYLDEYIRVGCDWITFHIEAVPEPTALLKKIRDAGRLAGIAINPGTPVDRIAKLKNQVDLVLVMSVEPGFGGQSFIPDAIQKVAEARSLFPSETLISIDGGIGPATIPDVAANGVDVYVAGSSIFDQPCYETAIREMTSIASSNSPSRQ
ncbi:ribulose-phosphate 3-epimerase [Thalassoglobus polymorphus]|uniref:Ribulose-phosphate 3-epimerase n=1 Tax=Thalassoglobus polymorphus TaxID=2527994 RepID=A0A517QI58_9PLAN|nr:ribulose-phosphate 3-epimerase [Thalassoglobus polymorphus]QDT31323.1 Ribulose-phosphate 3-epimerase [Thalassoglobus polymorphus]